MSNILLKKPLEVGIFLGVERLTGGMFQYALSVLDALSSLDKKKYSITIAYQSMTWAPILKRLNLSGQKLKYSNIGQKLADMAMGLRLPIGINQYLAHYLNPLIQELEMMRCDVWMFPAGETLTYQMKGKVIGVIHDLMHRYEPTFPEVSSLFRYSLREHRMGNIARHCTAVLVDSNLGSQHVISSYAIDPAKVYAIPYVAPSYIVNVNERNDFDIHYQLPSKFLFYPAQFWAHKNHYRLLEAVKIVAESRYSDINIVFSGAKRYLYEAVKSHAEKLNIAERVHFSGYVPDEDLRGFYIRAQALVMPSFFGPTNIPPLEAQATGCPVLVSDIYGMREQSGNAALYFDPKSVSNIADCISKVWSDDSLVVSMKNEGLARTQSYGQSDFNNKIEVMLNNF